MRLGGGPRLTTVVCLEDGLLLQDSDRALGLIAREAPEVWPAVGALLYRQLAGLERGGLIRRAYGAIAVLDPKGLRRFASQT